ncbi:methylated-DNA--protein-cysteine methyltransferase isoform X3 [Gopherus flavomarginatus]|nr:methylated-DNA--protein-cysteine methyltransferase isoform X3 [Gopherus flavomarginatus]
MASRLHQKVALKDGKTQCKKMHVMLNSPVGRIEISGCGTGVHEIQFKENALSQNRLGFPALPVWLGVCRNQAQSPEATKANPEDCRPLEVQQRSRAKIGSLPALAPCHCWKRPACPSPAPRWRCVQEVSAHCPCPKHRLCSSSWPNGSCGGGACRPGQRADPLATHESRSHCRTCRHFWEPPEANATWLEPAPRISSSTPTPCAQSPLPPKLPPRAFTPSPLPYPNALPRLTR